MEINPNEKPTHVPIPGKSLPLEAGPHETLLKIQSEIKAIEKSLEPEISRLHKIMDDNEADYWNKWKQLNESGSDESVLDMHPYNIAHKRFLDIHHPDELVNLRQQEWLLRAELEDSSPVETFFKNQENRDLAPGPRNQEDF